LLAGLALAFLMEFFDRTIDAPDDLERLLNLPALGSVREIHRVEFDGKDR
jgi:capsular polysaccharide biosynthesis protein